MRYLLYGVVGLIALVVGAAAIGPAFVDWNSYKDTISGEVFEATGRTLEINGDLALTVLPSPKLSASNVRLTSRPGSGHADMARLGALQVHVGLMPLLGGEIEVTSMTLVDPVLVYEVQKDGSSNWARPPSAEEQAEPAGRPAVGAPGRTDAGRGAVRFDRMRLENGTVIYRDLKGGTERKLEKISADIAAASLNGPFAIEGGLTSAETPLSFEARIGSLAGPGSAPVEWIVSMSDDPDTKLAFKGRLADARAAPRLSGTLTGDSSDLAKMAATITATGQGDDRFAAWRGQPFELSTKMEASADSLALNDVSLNLAGTRATGGVSLGFGDKPQVDVALNARRLDLDKLRQAFAPPSSATPAPGTAASPGQGAARQATSGFTLPKDLGGSINVSVGSATLMGRQVRGLKLAAALTEGEVTINQATAKFPGGAEAAVFGFVSSKGGKPRFDGRVEVSARSLRETLDWLNVDLGTLPRDRLRKFKLSAKVKSDESQIQATQIDMAVDATRLKGGITYALRDRPSFGANIALDKINLDAYLPGIPTAKPDVGKTGAGATGPSAKKTAAPAAMPIAVLNDVDANLVLSAGSLTYRQTPIQGLRLNGTLLAGKMTIKEARVRSVGGARLGIKGTMTNFAGFPAFKGTFDADAKNPAGLFRVLGITPIEGTGKLGRLKLAGRADTDEKRLKLDTKLGIAGGTLTIAGSVVDYRDKPTLDLTLNADHPDFRRLAATFGTELPGTTSRAGRLLVTATVKGMPDQLSLKTDIKALGGSASLAGQLKSIVDAPDVDLTVAAKHPDFIALMRDLAPDYRPAGKKIGAFGLGTRVRGNAEKVVLDQIQASIGPTDLSGSAELALGGARPSLTAALTASDLILDPLLPSDAAAGTQPAKARNGGQGQAAPAARTGRYSREPFDTAMLDSLDAKISIAAKSITRRKIRVDEPQIAATLKDSVLTLTKAEGKVFNGTLEMTGTLNGADVPAVDGKVVVRGASVERTLAEAADLEVVNGVMDLDLDLKGAGQSEHDLVSSLTGLMKLNARDGVIKGFDLPAVSKQLKDINRTTDILSLFAAGMGGGSTKFSRLDGTFRIVDGVAKTTDTKLVAEAGEATAAGTIDLPKWTINMDTTFRLSEHPKAPPFSMRLRGPIDEPRRVFQFKDLQAFLLRRSVDRFLKDVLPTQQVPAGAATPGIAKPQGEVAPATPALPAPPSPKPKPQPSQKIEPEEILRGLLQGLQNQ